MEFEQLKNVSGGSGPTDEDVTAGVRAYCGNCQRSVLAKPTGKDDGFFFNGDNMNTYALFVMGHFGTKHLYPLTKIRNCNCIYNFWRPSHMRGGFLFPDIRVERSSSLRSQMLRQRHSFSLACFFPPSKIFTPHHIVVDGFYKGFQEIFEQTLWCYELYHCRNDSDQTNQRCCP